MLTQEFREGEFYCKTAVDIGMVGRSAKPRLLNETGVSVAAAPAPGRFTILVASAATFDVKEDVAATALRQVEAAQSKGFPTLARETEDWWHEFWSRGFVHLSSADGDARFVERHYHYFLYLMASRAHCDRHLGRRTEPQPSESAHRLSPHPAS